MDKDRMLAVADAIEHAALPLRFNMQEFCTGYGNVGEIRAQAKARSLHCGTAGCIAGWACFMFGDAQDNFSGWRARQLLDLTESQKSKLFFNLDDYVSAKPLSVITSAEAVAAIRRMVAEEGSA